MLTVENRVKNGVEWLNSVMPFWYREIDLCSLDIEKPDFCVIGQVFGSYIDIYRQGLNGTQIANMGFTVYYFYEEEKYEDLQDEWIKVISEMQNTVNLT